MSHNWGYKAAAGMAKEMGLSPGPTRVTVKPHTRAPRIVKAPSAPAMPKPAAQGMPKLEQVQGFAKGGKVKCATGGPIHIKPANKGKLHAALGVKKGEKIPAAKIAKAAKSSNPVLKKRAVFAENAAKWKK